MKKLRPVIALFKPNSRRPHLSATGFTLVELLVSIVIFALLASMVAYSFGLSSRLVRYAKAPYAEETQNLSRLRDSLSSAFYYIGERSAMAGRKQEFYEYFYGKADEIAFVTTQPIGVEAPAISRLFVEGKTVFLEESALYDSRYDYLDPSLADRQPVRHRIMTDVDRFQISYFKGGESLGRSIEEIPSLIRLQLDKNRGKLDVYVKVGADFTLKKALSESRSEFF